MHQPIPQSDEDIEDDDIEKYSEIAKKMEANMNKVSRIL